MALDIQTFGSDGQYYYDDSTLPNCAPGPYPFQQIGPKTTYEVQQLKAALFARVDMPGVEPEGEVRVAVEKNTVVFRGEARAEAKRMGYESPRVYEGKFELLFVPDLTRRIYSVVKNGVLRFVVPAVVGPDVADKFAEIVGTVPLPLPSAVSGLINTCKKENANRNPFQVGGIKSTLEQYITTGDRMCMRADLPGVEKANVKDSFNEDRTWCHFECEALSEWEFEEKPGRFYSGKLGVNCQCCTISHVEAALVNGVFTLRVSKVKKKSDSSPKCDGG